MGINIVRKHRTKEEKGENTERMTTVEEVGKIVKQLLPTIKDTHCKLYAQKLRHIFSNS